MITRERLKELIKQGATIWSNRYKRGVELKHFDSFGDWLYDDGDISEAVEKPVIFTLKPGEYLRGMYAFDELEEYSIDTIRFKETYQNITRTETLSLPTWEEIKKGCATFFSDSGYLGFITPLDIIVINKYGNDGSVSFVKTIFNKELTKENYLKACELCRKLFLGEEE